MNRLFFLSIAFDFLWLAEQLSIGKKSFIKINKIRRLYHNKIIHSEYHATSLKKIEEKHIRELDYNMLSDLPTDHPVIFRGLAASSVHEANWNIQSFIQTYGGKKLIFFKNSELVSRATEEVSVQEALENIQEGNPTHTLYGVGKNDFDHIFPEMKKDLGVEKFCDFKFFRLKFMKLYRLLISGANTWTPLHFEFGTVLNLQISGSKRWIIFPPKMSSRIMPDVTHTLYVHSTLHGDLRKIDQKNLGVQGWEGVVNPGDVLYFPCYFWHYVESLENSLSLTYRWGDFKMLFRHPLMTFILLTSRKPNVFSQLLKPKGPIAIGKD